MRTFDPSSLKDLIEFISHALVDAPDAVEVNEVIGDQTTVIELKVAKTDTGKVIGREGRTAGALRTLLTGASAKLKRRAVLEIIE
ncbi:MAG: KH domain-containing protein [Bdellovibrionales bacterium]|nr:KH domain-containing protein [Bdellovibrionales bacterium]